MVEQRVGDVVVHYVEHGEGVPVLVLHGAGVDHRETEACFEPALSARGGFRRIYPDLPGMGRTSAPASIDSADAVLDILLHFSESVAGPGPLLAAGHSAGAHFAHGLALRRPDRVAGLALVCPVAPGVRDVPAHDAVIAADDLGDDEFRAYFVVQTPEMYDRYRRVVEPAARLADEAAMARIGARWELRVADDRAYHGPTLVVAGRQDSTVGYAAALDMVGHLPRATVALVDGAGHALPHEQPELLAALIDDWLVRATGAHHR